MTISTAQVQERLAKLIDPVAGIDYVSGKMLKGVETDDAGGVTELDFRLAEVMHRLMRNGD